MHSDLFSSQRSEHFGRLMGIMKKSWLLFIFYISTQSYADISFCQEKVPFRDPYRQDPPIEFLDASIETTITSPDSKFKAVVCRSVTSRPVPAGYLEVWGGQNFGQLIHLETYFNSFEIFSFLGWSNDSKYLYFTQDTLGSSSLVELDLNKKVVSAFSPRRPPSTVKGLKVCVGTLHSDPTRIMGYGFNLVPNEYGNYDAIPSLIIWDKTSSGSNGQRDVNYELRLQQIDQIQLPIGCTRYSPSYG